MEPPLPPKKKQQQQQQNKKTPKKQKTKSLFKTVLQTIAANSFDQKSRRAIIKYKKYHNLLIYFLIFTWLPALSETF